MPSLVQTAEEGAEPQRASAVPPFPPTGRRWPPVWLVLLCLALLLAGARLRTVHEPFESDIAIYLVIGGELLHGRVLYSEVWDPKPPGVYLSYAAALGAAGRNPELAVYLLGVLCGVVTMLGVFRAGRSLAGPGTGLLAAAAWVLVAGDLRTQANQPNAEAFMNAAHVWALALLLEAVRPSRRPVAAAAGAGLLLGLAAGFKQVSFVLVPPLALVLFAGLRGGLGWRRAGVAAAAMALVSPWAWAVTAAWFAVEGRWFDFRAAMLDFNAYYSAIDHGSILRNIAVGLKPGWLFPAEMLGVLPLQLMALAGTVAWFVTVRRRGRVERVRAAMLAASGAATLLAIAMPGRFYPHYFQLWLPLLCVVAAAGVAVLAGVAPAMRAARPPVLGGMLLLALAGTQGPSYLLSPDEWSAGKYGRQFIDGRDFGLAIGRTLRPGETLFVWGQNSGLYVHSGARPATGFFFLTPMLWSPHTEYYTARALADLRTAPPEMIVEDLRDVPPHPKHPLYVWIREAFVPLPDGALGQTRYRVWCRRGGPLAARLGAAGSSPR